MAPGWRGGRPCALLLFPAGPRGTSTPGCGAAGPPPFVSPHRARSLNPLRSAVAQLLESALSRVGVLRRRPGPPPRGRDESPRQIKGSLELVLPGSGWWAATLTARRMLDNGGTSGCRASGPGLEGCRVDARPESLLLPSQPQSGVRQAGEREDGDAAPLCDGERQPAAGRREGRAGHPGFGSSWDSSRPELGPASGQPPGGLPSSASSFRPLGGPAERETHSRPPLSRAFQLCF